MSITKRIFFGAAASWFSRGMTIVLGLVLLPVLFRTLPKEELGVWLLLGQSWATLGILDLGFGVTITRRIAFAKGRSGSDPNAALNDVTRAEIADLVATGTRIYRVLALLSFAVALGLGFLYLRSLTLDDVALPTVWTAWGVLCLSQALTVWATPWTCLLQGVGYIGWDAILASFVSALTLIGQIITALCGGGLVSLAVVAAAGALLQRSVILGFARRKRPELFHLSGQWCRDTFREMLPQAGRAWLTVMSYVIVANTDQLFISSFEGAEALPAYRAAVMLLINLHFAAGVFAGASQVFVSHLWEDGNLAEIRSIVRRNSLIGLLSMAAGGAVIFALGPVLFNLWLGPGNFVGEKVLFVVFVCFFLEHQANVFGLVGRATNDEAYAWTSVLSAGLKLGAAFWLVPKLGILALPLATLIAQGATNYWFMVYRPARRLGISLVDHAVKVLLPTLVVFLLVLFVSQRALPQISSFGEVGQICIVILFGGGILLSALWLLVLSPQQRNRFGKLVGIEVSR